jgi:hypothetical protein
MLRRVFVFVVAVIVLCGAGPAFAGIVIVVDKSAQRLTVSVDGARRYDWAVSTARWGYRTPNGTYRPERLERQWYSRKYDWSPMPHSIFFSGGYAIHGSNEVSRLGRPASHGCIRLHPQNAATLFSLVKGRVSATRIVVTGDGPSAAVTASTRRAVPDTHRPKRYSYERWEPAPPARYRSRYVQGFEEIFVEERRR